MEYPTGTLTLPRKFADRPSEDFDFEPIMARAVDVQGWHYFEVIAWRSHRWWPFGRWHTRYWFEQIT